MLLLTLTDTAKYTGKAQKNTTIALTLALVASVEIEAAEKVHDLFITKNCKVLIIEIFIIPLLSKRKIPGKMH